MLKTARIILVFQIGGICYGTLELLWRGYTHSSMLYAGGICFLAMFIIYNENRHLNIFQRGLIGTIVITTVEFIFGIVLNRMLKLDIWDYTNLRFNIMGQISLLYSFLWGLLSIPVSKLCLKLNDFFNRMEQLAV